MAAHAFSTHLSRLAVEDSTVPFVSSTSLVRMEVCCTCSSVVCSSLCTLFARLGSSWGPCGWSFGWVFSRAKVKAHRRSLNTWVVFEFVASSRRAVVSVWRRAAPLVPGLGVRRLCVARKGSASSGFFTCAFSSE